MKQFNEIKAKYPDALLLFRVGDFYETFGEDAVKTANILGIVLTKRANGSASFIDLAGFPHHSLDVYLPKLVRAGQRVAICDQLEDPKLTKTIVKRGVTELVTPGVSYNDKVLDHKSNNFLASVHFNGQDKQAGIAFLDVSTGEFYSAQGSIEYLDKLLQSFNPSEVLFQRNAQKQFKSHFGERFYTYTLDEWIFAPEYTTELLLKHFGTKSLKGFGVENIPFGTIAAGAVLHYLSATNHNQTAHVSKLSRIEEENFVWLDRFTIRNLELFSSANQDAVTLIDIIDQTVSPMGSRMLKRWLALPLKELQPIEERLEVVQYFYNQTDFYSKIRQQVQQTGDLERIISKVSATRINPRETVQLKRSLDAVIEIKNLAASSNNAQLVKLSEQFNTCNFIREKIGRELVSDPPVLLHKGGVIASGVNDELDELRKIAYSGKDYLLQIQKREMEKTGISSLKISYNNVFGYFLEVTNSHKNKVPQEWIRKQTLVNAERYITEELKQYEEKILGAEEKILAIESRLYNDLVLSLADYIIPVQLNASLVARLDCLISFAEIAKKNNYVRPKLNDSEIIDIKKGRHPVIEKQLAVGEEYVPNDVLLDPENQQIMIITGPNMSGKSALLRQTALITLLAQIGSFVPAESAEIGLVDKIFTRVGASDNISSGESTFMVEMNETASILNNVSNKSLILLDEIGRGTSTYDGISIAWAIAEFLHEHPEGRAKTLFATHYHELNDMAEIFPRIKNFNVSIKEISNKIIFLRKLVEGGSEHSFGIHVARMAGMPKRVIQRATEILQRLEVSHSSSENKKENKIKDDENYQLSFFQLDDPVLQQIKEEIIKTDINTLTPVEALMKLNDIKKLIIR
ncbi:MAG: DNA mismatch repair protein MutS [Bacteroidota bacterium]|nr:DNA mismatch repair protein MutS [Bacteroidota bacterium]